MASKMSCTIQHACQIIVLIKYRNIWVIGILNNMGLEKIILLSEPNHFDWSQTKSFLSALFLFETDSFNPLR